MRVIEKLDAGTHYQKSELRNGYNHILSTLDKQGKLFIDDRNSKSVAVMLSYEFYKKLATALGQIDDLQDDLDYEIALTRSKDKSKAIPLAQFKKALNLK